MRGTYDDAVRPSNGNADVPVGAAARGRYHHGDVANALIREAVALARHGGPEAVVLREAARRVGVSPTAAYRHLLGHENLLHAVKWEAQEALADALELGARVADEAVEFAAADRVEDAMRRAYEVGGAYVRFALAEPGLFRTAFCRAAPTFPAAQNTRGDRGDPTGPQFTLFRSFRVLEQTLDGLADAGLLPAERRQGAEIAAWCSIHGLACLLIDGSLAFLTDDGREEAVRHTIRTVLEGLVREPLEPGRL